MLPLLLPLLSAFIYALASLMLKRATGGGAGPWRVSFVANWMLAAVFAPFWWVGGTPFAASHLLHAVICGTTFFIGQIFTFLALNRGDVSVATPVLGTKVVFVALFTVLLGIEPLTAAMWMAAILTTIATALLGGGAVRREHALGPSLAFGFISAAAFAATDVLAQKWGRLWGFGRFAPVMFATVALLSLGLIPLFRGGWRQLAWRWLTPGAFLLALQASGVAYSIMVFGSATTTNVLYNSRGIWSVVLVWSVGHWFSNTERSHGHRVMLRRLAGAAVLLAAIVLIARR